MSKKYTHYSQEFKAEAVRLVTEQGYSVPRAAKHLGITSKSLYTWKEQLSPSKKTNLSELEELKLLRKEVKRLKMEKEILKKAAAFFAQEQD